MIDSMLNRTENEQKVKNLISEKNSEFANTKFFHELTSNLELAHEYNNNDNYYHAALKDINNFNESLKLSDKDFTTSTNAKHSWGGKCEVIIFLI